MLFSKILIANRGEIAVRIIRACKEMGVQTVGVYSDADREALHVAMADEAYCIGKASAAESYLNMDAIITVAKATGAAAIHPGYGLLSENAAFVRKCTQAGIKFIGPSAEVIERMGDKEAARRTMRAAGVPVVDGCDLLRDAEMAEVEAARVGCPVLIKARAGGGGRGIRRANTPAEARGAFEAAKAEAFAAFGDGECYLEKLVEHAHHIEVQLLCDECGGIVTVGERECSIQRKNQKLLEESPAPSVSPDLRREMHAAAVKAAKAVGYTNAGTVEFLVTDDGKFYFMEMNTRLQVEHPVSEFVSGLDLVKWQLRIASGQPLGFTQSDVRLRGHAIECRINAEDPAHDFRPSCGKVSVLHTPGGPWVRFDTALYPEYTVPPYYDSMIGKLIVHASTREEAVRKIRAALGELVIGGIETNAELQLRILSDKRFLGGCYHTDFMSEGI